MRNLELILRRSTAYFLDILFLFLVLAPLAFGVERLLDIQPQTNRQVWLAAILSFSVPVWSYFTLSDASKRGVTLGKRIMRISVSPLQSSSELTLGRGLLRTAIKLLPWELAHTFGFALADMVGEGARAAGLIGANVLTLLYFIVFVMTDGHRSIHDLVVGTQVKEAGAVITSQPG